MDKNSLTKLANEASSLDSLGQIKLADAIDNFIQSYSNFNQINVKIDELIKTADTVLIKNAQYGFPRLEEQSIIDKVKEYQERLKNVFVTIRNIEPAFDKAVNMYNEALGLIHQTFSKASSNNPEEAQIIKNVNHILGSSTSMKNGLKGLLERIGKVYGNMDFVLKHPKVDVEGMPKREDITKKDLRRHMPQTFKPTPKPVAQQPSVPAAVPAAAPAIAQPSNVATSIASMIKIANTLDEKGNSELADQIDKTASNLTKIVTAQYVGIQGYWIRNRRCWDNCYRQKRSENPGTPVQSIWSDCHKEYIESINNDESGWEKYAEDEINLTKTAHEVVKNQKIKIASIIENKIKENESLPIAIYGTVESMNEKFFNEYMDCADNVLKIASQLNEKGYKEESKDMTNFADNLIKEAGLWDTVKGGIQEWWKRHKQKGDDKLVQNMVAKGWTPDQAMQYLMQTRRGAAYRPIQPSPKVPAQQQGQVSENASGLGQLAGAAAQPVQQKDPQSFKSIINNVIGQLQQLAI